MGNKKIFVLDDEPDICELVCLHLKKNGFLSQYFLSASDFFDAIESNLPDLIILDLMLPDIDGLEICRRLKTDEQRANIPIIMLTAKSDEMDRIIGLELGADDYVTKPFSPRELVARVKAVLRRSEKETDKSYITIGKLRIDPNCYEVLVEDKKIDLTPTEFKILLILAKRPGWVFSRDQLLESLWGSQKAVIDRTIDVHIKNLREKLGVSGNIIKSVRGVGYKLEKM